MKRRGCLVKLIRGETGGWTVGPQTECSEHGIGDALICPSLKKDDLIWKLGWVKRLFGSFERRLNDVNDGVVVWKTAV